MKETTFNEAAESNLGRAVTDFVKEPAPSIGRTVHYVLPVESANVGHHLAAVVTGVSSDYLANLTVYLDQPEDVAGADNLNVRPTHRALAVEQDQQGAPGTWHWPEHVG